VPGRVNIVWSWDKQRSLTNPFDFTAIPALLEMLDISGCIITIDAMGTQKSIAEKIIAADADYILSLKENHPTLHQQVKNWFVTAQSIGFKSIDVSISQRIEKGHHRIEKRTVYTVPMSQIPELYQLDLWVGLKTMVMVVRSSQHWNKTTQEVQFYITSLASDANKIGSAIRQHWGIENSVHWTLDVTFNVREAALKERMNVEFVLCTVHRIFLCYVALLLMP
jgi:predicted transposase YbfD/YdcC